MEVPSIFARLCSIVVCEKEEKLIKQEEERREREREVQEGGR